MNTLSIIIENLRSFVSTLNEKGIPIPMIRVDGKASLTATMAFLSFNNALLGQLGKIAGLAGGVDLTNSNYLFGICLAAYLGRKMQGNGVAKTVEVEAESKKDGQ